jgi:hypothetical protein
VLSFILDSDMLFLYSHEETGMRGFITAFVCIGLLALGGCLTSLGYVGTDKPQPSQAKAKVYASKHAESMPSPLAIKEFKGHIHEPSAPFRVGHIQEWHLDCNSEKYAAINDGELVLPSYYWEVGSFQILSVMALTEDRKREGTVEKWRDLDAAAKQGFGGFASDTLLFNPCGYSRGRTSGKGLGLDALIKVLKLRWIVAKYQPRIATTKTFEKKAETEAKKSIVPKPTDENTAINNELLKSGRGTASINAKPWAKVTVRGKTCVTPCSLVLRAGTYRAKFKQGKYRKYVNFLIRPGKTTTVKADMTK